MILPLLLVAQCSVLVNSFIITSAPTRLVSSSINNFRQKSVKAAAVDEPEFFPLGNVNSKSTIDRDTFLFGEKVSFESCGIGEELIIALAATGKYNPTSIQAKTFTAIATGRDVIVGAETGSGKTLSYLLPIIQGLLNDGTKEQTDDDFSTKNYPSAIVMVPNKELCSQVYRMTNEIINNMPAGHNVSVGEYLFPLYSLYFSRTSIFSLLPFRLLLLFYHQNFLFILSFHLQIICNILYCFIFLH